MENTRLFYPVILLFSFFIAFPVFSGEITSVRHWVGPDRTRLVLDTDGVIQHSVFKLKAPERIVIDLKQTRLKSAFPRLNLRQSRIQTIRHAKRGNADLRIVLDMETAAQAKSYMLRPTGHYGHRLVLDVSYGERAQAKVNPKHLADAVQANKPRPVVVAIDAGHGGEDPGAIGQLGTQEKDVVLGISKSLYQLLEREPGIQPVMVRRGDYYVSLRKRMRLARRQEADLFISVHADAVKNGRARGASVYILSQKGASSEAARWLANSQNSSDLIGGVALDDKDDLLASVLLDLSQNATLAASMELGQRVLKKLGSVGRLHNDEVEKAGFVVLKSPDIPSILVETGFISNRSEERKLRDPSYQRRIANSLVHGVREYFAHNAVPGTVFARVERMHRIRPGETLSQLARRYEVSVSILKTVNRLVSDRLRVGQILQIPRFPS